MPDNRIDHAFDRIEKALARIETQAALSRHNRNAHSDLEKQHEVLRNSVSASLEELDGLIRELEA